jgi:hypothetical protein
MANEIKEKISLDNFNYKAKNENCNNGIDDACMHRDAR